MASLFQVPTPIVGLMGRRPGQNPEQTMLAQLLARGGGPSIEQVMAMQQQAPQMMQADAGDEMFAARDRERAAADQAALGGDNPRERVSGWRILDRVLGGQTVTEGLDEERARLQQIANKPNAMARNRQILESIQDPRERALFLADPEEWAKNVGQQFAPQVVGPGGVQAIGGRGVVGSPTYFESGDTLVERDPLSRTVAPVYTRTEPSISERTAQTVAETGRINALNPVNVGANTDLVNPQTGQTVYQGYRPPEVVSTPQGGTTNVIDSTTGRVINSVQGNSTLTPEDARRETQAREGRVAMAQNMGTALGRARQYVGTAGVWSAYNPLNRQDRANLEANLDTIKGNLTFENLSAMKAASPTGGSGLGALSDNEGRLLASTAASLDPDMSPQELERSFAVIDRLIAKMMQEGAEPAQQNGTQGVSREAAIAEARRRGIYP